MLAPEADFRIASDRSAPRLYCLLLCDLADSTALIERLGDARAADLMRQHDRVARDTLQRHHGREIDKTDGFLILFERPIEAVAFALDYQAELARIGAASGFHLRSRVGIHVGEILSWRNADADIAGGAKPVEVEGLAKAIAARLMALADPGQILLSESAYSLALRARGELPVEREVKWKEHGRYRLHGVAAPLPVFEVAPAAAPLQAPRDKIKARRVLPWYRWRPVYALLLLALAAAPLWYLLKPAPAIAFVERDWLVVGDLRNLTGDSRFDAPLDYALRVGLEQSRHVNVVGRSRMRETLERMQVASNAPLDRGRAGELAQRLGARAVLLPTLHQSGGRLRFTAELVDPHTGTTVYSHFGDALANDELLGALDGVLRALRSDLGETLSAIEASGPPLAQVTSPSLDAVRALVASNVAKREQRYGEAMALVEEALRLDPDFAMAYIARASLQLIAKRYAEADQDLAEASRRVERLSQRERLFVEASRAVNGPTDAMLAAWQALLALYPDDVRARYNAAYFATEFGNDCRPALGALQPGPQETVAEKGMRLYEVARCELIEGRLDAAAATFAEANASGLIGNGPEFALLQALRGDFAAARQTLAREHHARGQSEREVAEMTRLALLLLQGDWAGTQLGVSTLLSEAASWPSTGRALVGLLPHLLAPQGDDSQWEAAATAHFSALLGLAESASRQEARLYLGHAGALAWVLARHGRGDHNTSIQRWGQLAEASGQQTLRDLHQLITAEQRLRAGDAAGAISLLAALPAERQAYLVRATRLRAHLQAGDAAAAGADCRWLQAHAGRAGAERFAGGALALNGLIERAQAPGLLQALSDTEACPADEGAAALRRVFQASRGP